MPILGAHMSMAGGYFRAVERAAASGCQCVQLFTKNNNQWRARDIQAPEIERFQQALAEHEISHPISHASYLINLASPDQALWQKSVDAMVVELDRADQFGISGVVVHPGAYIGGDEQQGIAAIIEALNELHRRGPQQKALCLLETTAGQGTSLGCRFEHLAAILKGVEHPERLGICVDTCHIFAAGYDIRTMDTYEQTMDQLQRQVGIDQVKAIHLNDSKRELGSRVDRHEHIGKGCLGLEAFRLLLHDPRFAHVPAYLETPKDKTLKEDWDRQNLETLRSL